MSNHNLYVPNPFSDLAPSPRPPRFSTTSGRVAERGDDLGTVLPHLVPQPAWISPRRVPRDASSVTAVAACERAVDMVEHEHLNVEEID